MMPRRSLPVDAMVARDQEDRGKVKGWQRSELGWGRPYQACQGCSEVGARVRLNREDRVGRDRPGDPTPSLDRWAVAEGRSTADQVREVRRHSNIRMLDGDGSLRTFTVSLGRMHFSAHKSTSRSRADHLSGSADDLDEPANQNHNRTIKVYQPGSSASSASSIPSTSDDFLEDNTPKPESDLNKRFGAGSAGVGGTGAGSGSSGLGGEERPAAQKIDLGEPLIPFPALSLNVLEHDVLTLRRLWDMSIRSQDRDATQTTSLAPRHLSFGDDRIGAQTDPAREYGQAGREGRFGWGGRVYQVSACLLRGGREVQMTQDQS